MSEEQRGVPSLVLPQGIPEESDDAPKKFRNIDTEVFEDNWDGIVHIVQPGEVVIKPKYLVNHMAMHLARKMYKRQAFAAFQGTEREKQSASIRFVNPAEEHKLQVLMVADNFPEVAKPEAPIIPTAETVVDKSQVEIPPKPTFKCEKCEFTAKSKAGVLAHARRKHK